MAATLVRVVFDSDGKRSMTFHPDWDEQLQMPNLAGSDVEVAVDLPKDKYDDCRSEEDVQALALSYLPGYAVHVRQAINARRQARSAAEAVAPNEG